MNWTIRHEPPWDGEENDYWIVSNDKRWFKCIDEDDAKWLVELFKTINDYEPILMSP